MRILAGGLFTLLVLAVCCRADKVSATECYPHCDYNHYLGPYDYSYISPGLFGYLACDRFTVCSPHQVYRYSRTPTGRIEIVFPRQRRPRP